MLNIPIENSRSALNDVKEVLIREKEAAVSEQDFGTAMVLRDATDLVKKALKRLEPPHD